MTSRPSRPSARTPRRATTGFWVAMLLGGSLVLFGVVGLLGADGSGLGSFVPYFVGGALVLDLVVVPAAAGVGVLARRLVPAPAWPAVRAALLSSATLAVFALPLVLGVGGAPGNPSLRPRRYGPGLAAAVAVVWSLALVVGGSALLRARAGAGDPEPDPGRRP